MRVWVVLVLVALLPQLARANPIGSADRIVWVGVDYTQALYFEPPEFMPEAERMATYFPERWNWLVVEELIGRMSRRLRKPVYVTVEAMNEHNSGCTVEQSNAGIGRSVDTHLSPEAVAAAVAGWPLDAGEGCPRALRWGSAMVPDRDRPQSSRGSAIVYTRP